MCIRDRRGIAVTVPEWQIDKCIQCGTCSLVCPHACIRPIYASEEVMKGAPEGYQTKPATGKMCIRDSSKRWCWPSG